MDTSSPSFDRRVIVVAPVREHAFDQAQWRDAIVVVERGEIEPCAIGGTRRRFGRGALLCLDGLPLRCLHNRGPQPAALLAVSRAAPIPPEPVRRLNGGSIHNPRSERS